MSPRRCTVSFADPQSASTFVTRCPIVTDIVHTHLCSSNTRRRRVNNSSTYTMSVCEMYSSGSFLTSRVLLSKQLECTTNTPAPTNSTHTVYTHVVMSIRWTGHTCVVYRLCISSSATVAVTCDALSEFPKQSYWCHILAQRTAHTFVLLNCWVKVSLHWLLVTISTYSTQQPVDVFVLAAITSNYRHSLSVVSLAHVLRRLSPRIGLVSSTRVIIRRDSVGKIVTNVIHVRGHRCRWAVSPRQELSRRQTARGGSSVKSARRGRRQLGSIRRSKYRAATVDRMG